MAAAPQAATADTTDRWEKLAPLSGVLFVVFTVAGIVLTNAGTPEDFPAKPADVVDYYEDKSDQILIGVWLGVIGSFLFLWFGGVLRSRLRVAEGGTGRLANTVLAGVVAAAVGGILIDTCNFAAAIRADEDGKIPVDIATTLYDLQGTLLATALPIGIAVFVAATGLLALRTGVLPRWLGFISLVLAVGLLVPFIAWAVTALGLLWVLVVSILLWRKPALPVTQVPAQTPA